MSLVSNLISGSTGNFGMIDAKKYGHDTGALRIATESAEALHDIFIEGFYNVEQAELAAVHEGVTLEGSQYEAITEASVSNVFAKVKEFFKKLWEKVKAFFHNIRRYIDSIFMSGKDFVKKYDADIRKATNLKDFEYKMYKYTNIDRVPSIDVETEVDGILKDTSDGKYSNIDDMVKAIVKFSSDNGKKTKLEDVGFDEETTNDLKAANDEAGKIDDDAIAKDMANTIGLKNVSEYSDIAGACFAFFRNGAEDKNDMDTIEISSLSEYVSTLKAFKSSALDKAATNVDKAYKNAIKRIDSLERDLSNSTERSNAQKEFSRLFSLWSSIISKCQNITNTYYSAWKTAAKERDSAYKSMIVKAIAYSNKRDKNK